MYNFFVMDVMELLQQIIQDIEIKQIISMDVNNAISIFAEIVLINNKYYINMNDFFHCNQI